MLRRRTRAALHHAAWSCIYSPPAGIGLMSEAEPSIGRNRQEHLGVLEPLRITSSTEQMHASAPASCKAAISTMPLPGLVARTGVSDMKVVASGDGFRVCRRKLVRDQRSVRRLRSH
jgi:hypothetical protein